MSLLWKYAGMDPLDIQRSLDKVRDEEADKHQDDAKYAVNWKPLHNSDLHPSEHDGWMFMENGHPHDGGFYKNAPSPLTTYKHGITRQPLHLDENGGAYRRTCAHGEDHFDGPHSAKEVLSTPQPHRDASHYEDLATMGHAPETQYNEDFMRERNKKLNDAGYTVIS